MDQLRRRLGFDQAWEAIRPLPPGMGLSVIVVDNYEEEETSLGKEIHGNSVASVIRALVPFVNVKTKDSSGGDWHLSPPGSVINGSVGMGTGSSQQDQGSFRVIEAAVRRGSVVILSAGNDSILYGSDFRTWALAKLAERLNQDPSVPGALIFVGSGFRWNKGVLPATYSNMAGIVPGYFITVPFIEELTLHRVGAVTNDDLSYVPVGENANESESFTKTNGTSNAAPVVTAALLLLRQFVEQQQGVSGVTGKQLVYTLLNGAYPTASHRAVGVLRSYMLPGSLKNSSISESVLVGSIFDLRAALARLSSPTFLSGLHEIKVLGNIDSGFNPQIVKESLQQEIWAARSGNKLMDILNAVYGEFKQCSAVTNLLRLMRLEKNKSTEPLERLSMMYLLYAANEAMEGKKVEDPVYLQEVGLHQLEAEMFNALSLYRKAWQVGQPSLHDVLTILCKKVAEEDGLLVSESTKQRLNTFAYGIALLHNK